MLITKTGDNQTINLSLAGRLDTTTSPQFQEVLLPAFDETEKIIIDLTNLVYISSAGLRILLMGLKIAQAKNKKMILRNVSNDVMDVLNMTGFTELLTIE